MDDEIETLLIDVRASTAGFRSDIETMRGALDATLVEGFAQAGSVLERGLLSAIRKGTLGFDDLKRVALDALGQIAAQAVQGGIGSLFGSAPSTSGSILTGALGALFGLPGRATAGRWRRERPMWSASAGRSCSCRLRPDGWKRRRGRRAMSASRSRSCRQKAAMRRRFCGDRRARWRVRCEGRCGSFDPPRARLGEVADAEGG